MIIQFLLKKMLRVFAILIGASIITFILIRAIPGSPWSNYATSPRMFPNFTAAEATLRELNRRYGLDLPAWRQFTRFIIGDVDENGRFFCAAVCGNFGPSMQQRGRPIQDILFRPPRGLDFWHSRFGYSIRLMLFSSVIVIGLGIPLGVLSATQPHSAFSRFITVSLAALTAIPNFVLGLLAIVILASWLHLMKVLPDWSQPESWIVPAFVLAVMPMASMARLTRASIIHIFTEDYVRTARAKGLTQVRVVTVHVVSNALVPIITYLGPTLLEMFTGLFIVEHLYSFPGIGRLYWDAVLNLDYPMILSLTIIYAVGVAFVHIGIDLLSAILDPRVRAAKQLSTA